MIDVENLPLSAQVAWLRTSIGHAQSDISELKMDIRELDRRFDKLKADFDDKLERRIARITKD